MRRLLVNLHVCANITENLNSDECDPIFMDDVAREFNKCVRAAEQTGKFEFDRPDACDYYV